jgi:hypothetical protein
MVFKRHATHWSQGKSIRHLPHVASSEKIADKDARMVVILN